MNGKDENLIDWGKTCGVGDDVRHVGMDTDCSVFVQYKCQAGGELVDLSRLCDRVSDCSGESEVCSAARLFTRRHYQIQRHSNFSVGMLHCLPGLESLGRLAGGCQEVQWKSPNYPVFGVKQEKFIIPTDLRVDCSFTAGLLYVYMSCLGLCHNAQCPLTPVTAQTCTNLDHVTYSISNNSQLTIVEKKNGGFVESPLFACDNNICIAMEKVCDRVDDCGDNSDERNCTNHYQCTEVEEYVPHSKVNDGNFDCIDYSDECNDVNSKEIINEAYLRVLCWTMGLCACVANVTVLCQSIRDLREVESSVGLTNRVLIILISIGDLAIGAYLIIISVIDTVNRTKGLHFYCKNQVFKENSFNLVVNTKTF